MAPPPPAGDGYVPMTEKATDANSTETHYTQGNVLSKISEGIPAQLGVTPDEVTTEALGETNVDEFHVGGGAATLHVLDKLNIKSSDRVLDIGCGLGGPSRRCALQYGCTVIGVDLTKEFVEAGSAINAFKTIQGELQDRVKLVLGDATCLDPAVFPSNSIDKAYSIHVAINIEAKYKLASEIFRVLKPGGRCIFFDQMATLGPHWAPRSFVACCSDRKLAKSVNDVMPYPMPWATQSEDSHCATAAEYKTAFSNAGFKLITELEEDRTEDMLAFMNAAQKKMMLHFIGNFTMSPPPLGIHVVLGPEFVTKIGNYKSAVVNGQLAVVELVFEKPV